MTLFARKQPGPRDQYSRSQIWSRFMSGVFMLCFASWFAPQVWLDADRKQHIHDTFVPVQAKIIASHVESNPKLPRQPYYLRLIYAYTVNGATFQTEDILYESDRDNGKANAEAALQKYAPGAGLTVYGDPAFPGHTVMSNAAPDMRTTYLEMAGLWLAAAFFFIKGIAGLRQLRR
jgi:hypothetical protein